MDATTKQSRYRVEGMDCASCATKIDTAVRRVPGVEDVSVSVTAGTMTVRHKAESDLAALANRVTGLGYKVALLPNSTAGSWAPESAATHGHGHATPAEALTAQLGLHGHDHGPGEGAWWESG